MSKQENPRNYIVRDGLAFFLCPVEKSLAVVTVEDGESPDFTDPTYIDLVYGDGTPEEHAIASFIEETLEELNQQ